MSDISQTKINTDVYGHTMKKKEASCTRVQRWCGKERKFHEKHQGYKTVNQF